jgi:hypothetical protein
MGLDGWEGRHGQTISQLSYLNSAVGVKLTAGANGIWFDQIPEGNLVNLIGRTVTMSCGYAISGGTVHGVAFGTGVVHPFIDANANDVHFEICDTSETHRVGMWLGNYADSCKMTTLACGSEVPEGTEFWLEWVKLELGKYFTGPPPLGDPAVELERCKRLYEVALSPHPALSDIILPPSFFWRNDTPAAGQFKAILHVKFAVEKKTRPLLTHGGTFRVVGYAPGGAVTCILNASQVVLESRSVSAADVSLIVTGAIPAGTVYVNVDSSGYDGWIAFDAS